MWWNKQERMCTAMKRECTLGKGLSDAVFKKINLAYSDFDQFHGIP